MPLTTAIDDRRLSRRARVIELVCRGYTQRAIGEEVGVSVATVNADLQELREEWRDQSLANIEQAMLIDLQRIDVAIDAIWEDVKIGQLDTIEVLIKLIKQRAAIMGYEGPTRIGLALQNRQIKSVTIREVLVELPNSERDALPPGEVIDQSMLEAAAQTHPEKLRELVGIEKETINVLIGQSD